MNSTDAKKLSRIALRYSPEVQPQTTASAEDIIKASTNIMRPCLQKTPERSPEKE
jgi:hypothetical protein